MIFHTIPEDFIYISSMHLGSFLVGISMERETDCSLFVGARCKIVFEPEDKLEGSKLHPFHVVKQDLLCQLVFKIAALLNGATCHDVHLLAGISGVVKISSGTKLTSRNSTQISVRN